MIRVVHVITGLIQGGAETVLYRLVTSKDDEIHHTVISMGDFGVYGEQLAKASIEVHMLGMPRGRLTIAGIVKLFRLLRKLKPDVVQTWMYHADLVGGILARVAGIKNVYWGIVNFNLDRKVAGLSTHMVAKACALVSGFIPKRIVCCSEKAIQSHQEFGYSSKKFVYIPLGFDLNEYKINLSARQVIRKDWGINDNEILIGCIARWDPMKDHKTLLTALHLLNKKRTDFHCVLIGPKIDSSNPGLLDCIEKTGNKTNKKLILAGKAESVPDVMNALDLHVLSSVGEAFPNVVAEAMACGTGCLVTDVGDAATIVGNTGWIVPHSNPEEMAIAIDMILDKFADNEFREKISKDARESILLRFSLAKMVESYKNLWYSSATN